MRPPVNYWTEDEIRVLRALYHCTPIPKLVEMLPGRGYYGIASKARELKLRSGPSVTKLRGQKLKIWTEADIALLKEIYADSSTEELRKAFCPRRTLKSVHKQAERFGIKRTEAAKTKCRKEAWAVFLKRQGKPEDAPDPVQTIVIRPAPKRDHRIVFDAIERRTPLEQAWSMR